MDRTADATPRPSAKTDKIGFLHLSSDVRNRIYQLAIYDHDRGAVYLPRTLPRKSVFETTEEERTYDSTYADVRDDDDTDIQAAETDWDDRHVAAEVMRLDYAGGHWTDGNAVVEAERLQMEFDQASEPVNDSDADGDEDAVQEGRLFVGESNADDSLRPADLGDPLELSSVRPRTIRAISRHLCGGPETGAGCQCSCHKHPLENVAAHSMEGDLLSKPAFDPSAACRSGECSDETCEDCDKLIKLIEVMCPSCQDTTQYPPKSNEVVDSWAEEQDDSLYPQVDEVDDDAEHFDSEETIGMLYEPKEPAILLTCREIRSECLPIYYSKNTFTWRFFWLNYIRSCSAFQGWVANVGTEHTKHIQKITFEGRHAVEEGIEFAVDINLLIGAPYFSVQVSTQWSEEQYLETICQYIERDLVYELWKMLPRTGGIKLSPADLARLGQCFVDGMHRSVLFLYCLYRLLMRCSDAAGGCIEVGTFDTSAQPLLHRPAQDSNRSDQPLGTLWLSLM